MLLSGSNRIGANDFQARPMYVARSRHRARRRISWTPPNDSTRVSAPAEIAAVLVHGTSVGGAFDPRSLARQRVEFPGEALVLDRPLSGCQSRVAAMALARMAGIDAAETSLRRISGRDALLVRRFDRVEGAHAGTWSRG